MNDERLRELTKEADHQGSGQMSIQGDEMTELLYKISDLKSQLEYSYIQVESAERNDKLSREMYCHLSGKIGEAVCAEAFDGYTAADLREIGIKSLSEAYEEGWKACAAQVKDVLEDVLEDVLGVKHGKQD